jgi:uncharacterized membrane protein
MNSVEKFALAAFLVWSAAGLFFIVERITPLSLVPGSGPPWLVTFVNGCQEYGDIVLILLAFINTHLHAVRQWSAGIARRWAAIVIVCAFCVESFGAITSFPFGNYQYSDRFGPLLGVVPVTIPFAWHIVVTNALFVIRAVLPNCPRTLEAVLTGLISAAYDYVLEPFATTVKGYWKWSGNSVPPINYLAWFVISGALALIFAPILSSRYRADPRPWLVLMITVLIFLAGRAYHG